MKNFSEINRVFTTKKRFLSLWLAFVCAGFMMVNATTYTVVGSSAAIFGTAWTPGATANDMVSDGNVFKLVKEGIELPAGTVEYKIVEDHAWTKSYPQQGNASFHIGTPGKYDITFTLNLSANNPEYSVEAKLKEEVEIDPTASIKGAWNSWANEVNFVLAGDKKSASVTKAFVADTYEFKVIINGDDWRSNGATLTREASESVIEGNVSDNLKLVADIDGEYTFTWTFDANKLEIAFPEKSVDPTPEPLYYIIGSEAFGNWSFVPVYKDTFEIKDLAAGDHMFRIAFEDGNWDNCVGFSHLTETPAGVTGNNDNNILFTYTEAGDFKVVYNSTEFKVFGNFYVAPAEPKKYYAKYAPDWTWKLLTEKDGLWLTDTIVYGGIGININDAEADENNMFYSNTVVEPGVRPIAGAEIAENDTILFSFNPADSVLTAVLVGKYVEPKYDFKDGFYLVGDKYNWTPAAERLLLANTETEGEYYLADVTLSVDDSIKVVWVEKDVLKDWYPDGDNYVVDADHAGVKTIYFNPTWQIEWNSNIFIAPNPKYYAKYAPDWTWKLLTEKDGLWLTDTIVYGGIGVNINNVDADENNMFYSNTVNEAGVRPIKGAEIEENDTVLFSFNPADSVLTAVLVGKYVAPVLKESSVIFDTEDPNVAYTVKCGDATVTPSVKIVEGTKLFVKAESKKYEYIIKSLRAYKVENEEEVPVPIVNDTLEMPAADLHIVATVGFHEAKIAGLDGTWAGELLKTAEDGKSATVTLNLPFGPKTFKMIIDGNWLGEGEAFTRKAVAHKMTSLNSSTNATLDVDIKGAYTFTWNFADSTLTVGYPAAPDTVDIFFVNTFKDWANVYAYIYEDTIGVEDWPGVKMTKDEKKVQGKDLYKVTALTSYSTIVFNNGKSEGEVVGIDQTVDLLWDSSNPVYCDGKWYADTASVDEIEPAKYFLTGNEALVEHFGMASTSAWKGRIKAIEDTLVIENLAEGYYKLRVVNTKDQWIGFSQLSDQTNGLHADIDDNICFMMTNAGNVTVVYKESATDTIFTVKGDYETATMVALAGGFNDWDMFANLFEVAEGGLKATLTTHLEAGIDSIKVVSDGNWLSLNGDGEDCFYIHRLFPQTGSLKATDLRNLVINADVAGDYTFTWTFADSTLAVAYPNLPKDDNQYAVAGDCLALFYHKWRAYHDYGYTDLTQQADGMFKWEREEVVLPQGEVRFKICQNKSFDNSWPAEDYVLAIPENGEYTVTILFNVVSHDIFATATKTGDATYHDPIDLKGSWDSWAEDHRCIIDEGNVKALITMNLTAGDYEFKFHSNDKWFGNGQEFTRENNSIRNIAENVEEGNMILHADVEGDYLFTWIFDQNHAIIQFPSLVPAKKISRLNGEFSVSDSTKVNFSRGNLQYNFGAKAWYAATKQHEVLADANLRLGDETYEGSVDLFSWSCENSNYGLLPSNANADFTSNDFKDWGELFAGEEDTWRTLSSTEFDYLLNHRKDANNNKLWTLIIFGEDKLAGMALFPDNWDASQWPAIKYAYVDFDNEEDKAKNTLTEEQWKEMEEAGAVFLPLGGARAGAVGNYVTNGEKVEPDIINPLTGSYCWVSEVNELGYYWLSDVATAKNAHFTMFPGMTEVTENVWIYSDPWVRTREKRRGHNVRLVTEAKAPVVEPIFEIKFTEAADKGTLIDSTFTVEGSTFSVKTTDPDGNMSIDNPEKATRFGTQEAYTAYTHRLKSGGSSSSDKNYLTLTIPEDGILRLAVRSAKDADDTRMVYVVQNDDTVFQHAPDVNERTVVSEDEIYYPYYEMYVRAGEATITYPVNGVNFYSFTFRAAEVPAKFYIVGNTAELGAWKLENAIKSEEDSYTLHLEAGDYMMKVLTRGLTWDEGLLGYDELSVKKYGITRGEDKDENNICFTLNEAGDVVVEYKAPNLTVSGNFYVDPATIPHYFIAGTMTGWKDNMVEMTAGDNNTYTADIAVAADTKYEFKVVRTLGTDTVWYGIENPGTMVYNNCTNWQMTEDGNNVGLQSTKAGAYTFTFVANDKRELSVNIPSIWDEIVFTADDVQDAGTDAFDGKVFTAPNSEFSITCHDELTKIAIDANPATFGTEEDHTKYTHRIKTGGKIAYFDVNIPTDGILRLAVCTGNNADEDRTVVVIQNGDTIFQQAPKESDKVDGRYPYFEMYVHAGTATIHTPVNGDSFYSFAHRHTKLQDGFYLIGQNGWSVDDLQATDRFVAGTAEGEYVLNTSLAENDKLKVVKVESDTIANWYPMEGDDYVVTAKYAGDVTIYFREKGNTEWEAFGGYMWIEKKGLFTVGELLEYMGTRKDTVHQIRVTGNVSTIVTAYSSKYKNITFDFSDTGNATESQLRAYRTIGEEAANIAVGDKVVLYGDYLLYNGKTPEMLIAEIQSRVAIDREHPTLVVSGEPDIKKYGEGQTFKTNGLKVEATYNTGYKEDVTADVTWHTNLAGDVVMTAGVVEVWATFAASTSNTIEVAVKVAEQAPEFSPEPGLYLEPKMIEISAAPGATIYYTIDGSEPSAASKVYSEPFELGERKVYTVKAIAYSGAHGLSQVVSAEYDIRLPFTVAEAIDFIGDNTTGIADQYVEALVCQIDKLESGRLTYWISDNGKTDEKLEAYRGYNLNGEDFDALDDLKIGDLVLVKGTLKKYNNFYEFDQNNVLISHKVAEPSIITISGTPNLVKYAAGQTFDPMGLNVTALYTTGYEKDVTSDAVFTTNLPENTVTEAGTVKVWATWNELTNETPYEVAVSIAEQAPMFNNPSGEYTTELAIMLTAAEGATIYYTLDGTDPTEESTVYSQAIELNERGTTTIKAIAIRGTEESQIVSATYTINLPYNSLAELVADDPAIGTHVSVAIDNYITYIISNRTGVYLDAKDKTGETDVEIYFNGHACGTSWKKGDHVKGQVVGTWDYYENESTNEHIWEIKPDGDWDWSYLTLTSYSKVYFDTPENGTLEILNGEAAINYGDAFAQGTKLTVMATPAEGYTTGTVQVFDTQENDVTESVYANGKLTVPNYAVQVVVTFPEKEPEDITLYFVNKPFWEEVHYYVWKDGIGDEEAWPGLLMNSTSLVLEDKAASTSYDVYSCTFPETYNKIIFNNGTGGGANQTSDQEWDSARPYFYDGIWYATLEEIDTEAKATFYISGDGALVGQGSVWDPKAIKSLEDSYTLDLNPGIYQLKINLDGTADTWRGFNELTSIADGLNPGLTDPNAIEFVIATPSSVVVTYKVVDDEVTFTLNGNFYTLADGYYLAGQDKWDVLALDETVKFEPNTSNPGEYVLSILLAAEDKIQAVEVKNNRIYWFGETFYTVDATHAGNADVYFRPEYQENWYEFGGYIYVYVEGGGTGMDEIGNTEKAVKVMMNGQLLIIKNGKTYNGQGQLVK